jgi:hypothetical protein
MTWEEACRILGFSVNATPAEIKNQWLYKANLLHPDKTANLPENMRIKAEEDFTTSSQIQKTIRTEIPQSLMFVQNVSVSKKLKLAQKRALPF